ncbi:MAG: electron transfer flavoprotein subunit alpha/FixB family protein [Chloroflexi bacterium]|nr:electron transfer flavoprotein subunit alpha/FixB family protein [Chloroflexota bacterium]
MKNVLVVAEHKAGVLDPITLQLLAKGRQLADELGGCLIAVLPGYRVNPMAEALAQSGVDEVIVNDDSRLEHYSPETYLNAITHAMRQAEPRLLFLGHTYLGIELGPAVSARLDLPLVTNCVDVELQQEKVLATRPMFGSLTLAKLAVEGPSTIVVTVQRGAFPVVALTVRQATISKSVLDVQDQDIKTRVLSVLEPPQGKIDIAKADIIVAVGRGIRDKANLPMVEKLAGALGGVVGCSRPLADLGWLPIETHVGISGKMVRPHVYLALGISGAAQHVGGMKDSNRIIAVNNDSSAPIFNVAHYGAVMDLFELLPLLIQEATSESAK